MNRFNHLKLLLILFISQLISSDSITENHLQNNVIGSNLIIQDSVTSSKIASNSIENRQVSENSIDLSKLSTEFLDKLYVCEIRQCDECKNRYEEFILEHPNFEDYSIQKCASREACKRVEMTGGFYE
eukprot:gb/GECH01011543.1/.p1 GENE.gb/GECH01011543.1/~~gb/GECH01011543.1/.p1  ORF type:complete len:128 (+),score=18.30 gb/GECH01011543.1/:1-384(+)